MVQSENTYGGLRERATRYGLDTLDDIEALAVLLARMGVRDAATLAARLIDHFGSYAAVLGATQGALINAGAKAAVALDIKLTHDAAMRVTAERLSNRCMISSWTALQDYLRARMGEETREQFRVLFLDKRNALIKDEVMGHGTVDHAPVYPREVMRRALELDASCLILVHNHPSGDPTPSAADIDMTRQIVEAGRTLRISIHDHMIVGKGGEIASLKAKGLM